MDDYERIIRPIQPQLIQTVWRLLGNGDDADEALQQALIRIWKSWPTLLRHPNPRALALKICGDCAYDELRRRSRRFRHQPLAEHNGSLRHEPSEQLSRSETRETIMDAIARLSRNQAVGFVMREIQGQSYQEIAAVMGCGEATARKHVDRAKHCLANYLANLNPCK